MEISQEEKNRVRKLIKESEEKNIKIKSRGDGDGRKMKASKKLLKFIMNEEGDPKKPKIDGVKQPKYKAYYDVNDEKKIGTLTIGYGHIGKGVKMRKIDMDTAIKLLSLDLKVAEECVNRFFDRVEKRSRKNNGKSDYHVTQDQFDGLVSLVFNTGCGATVNSNWIDDFEYNKLEIASRKILNYRTGNLSGIKKRRVKEAKMILSSKPTHKTIKIYSDEKSDSEIS